MQLKTLLKSYLRKLTNLTASNRSLVVLKLFEESDLDLYALEYSELGRSSFQILEQVIKSKKEIHLCDYIDSRDTEINKLSKKLSKIYHKSKLIEEERGAKDLYIGYPFVTGKFQDGSIVRCPLFFFPVEIQLVASKKNTNQWTISPIANELPFINRSFLLAYSHFNQLELNDDLLDYTLEEDFSDSLSFRNWLYEFLKSSALSINFNSELFQNQLKPFAKYTKAEFEGNFENGILKLESQCVLGIFPQSGSYLAPDYEQWLDSVNEATVEDFFVEKNIANKPVKEESILTAFPIDASQEQAIIAIKSGKSMVVQGPPGTGKSQLISNLATDFAANGKKVLVVCQKRAALDVVHQRLSKIGLENFVALVHDFKSDRKNLYDQLNQQIDNIDFYKSQNASFNMVVIEREFLHTSRSIEDLVDKLQSFKTALFDNTTFGISAKELFLKSDPNKPYLDFTEKISNINYQEFGGLMSRFSALFDYAKTFELDEFAWKGRLSFKNHSLTDFKIIKSQLLEIQTLTQQVNFSYDQVIQFFELKNDWGNWISILQNPLGFEVLLNIASGKQKFNFVKAFEKLEELEKWQKKQIILFENDELALQYHSMTELAINRHSNFVTKWWWKLVANDAKLVTKLLIDNGLPLSKASLQILKLKIEGGIQFSNTSDLLLKSLKLNFKLKFALNENPDLIQDIRNALVAAESVSKYEVLQSIISYESDQWLSVFENLVIHSQTLNQLNPLWKRYFTVDQLERCFEVNHFPDLLSNSITTHFDGLVEYDRLILELSAFESSFFYASVYYIKLSEISKSEFLSFVQNSLFLSWINILEQNEPILRSTETMRLTQLEEELQQMVLNKQKLATEIIQLKLKERIYEKNVFNRLNNRLTYRELQHQLTKKKKIWKLRKMIESFHSEVFDLAPIWLVSPETVSTIFPFEPLFDLIIFDEASQCFAEKGFAAMYRGLQVVIAGDSKQLQPNDLYQPRFETEQDADTDSEIDSLLSISQKYISQTTLTGHYRSLLPELIGFSNEHFYENKLQILPEYELMQSGKPPIHYIKTEGVWNDNCNL
ncbi:MAG: AAA domain-containing protein, partial [Cytophagales bacterium]